MNSKSFLPLLALAAGLGSLPGAVPARASIIVDLTARTETFAGIDQQTISLRPSPDIMQAEIRSEQGTAGLAVAQSTFELAPVKNYAAPIDTSGISFLNDTRWLSKHTAHLEYGPGASGPHEAGFLTTLTRGSEAYFVYAIAPSSASGFATDIGPSIPLGGPGFRFVTQGFFYGGNISQFDVDAPRLTFGNGFGDSFGQPPAPDFNTALLEYNLGAILTVDLDAAGVGVGDQYFFRESYRLGVGPGLALTLDELDIAFLNLDPVLGIAFIPEPGAMGLLCFGLAVLARRRLRRI